MSGFSDSFGPEGDDHRPAGSARPFDDGYLGYDPRLPSQRFDAFSTFTDNDSTKDAVDDSTYAGLDGGEGDGDGDGDGDGFPSQAAPDTPPIYGSGGGFSAFSPESNGKAGLDGDFAAESDGPILPPPSDMQPEEGFMLREWRRW